VIVDNSIRCFLT